MKRIACIVASLAMVFALALVPMNASAASSSENAKKIVNACKEAVPSSYQPYYLAQLENGLAQLTITDDQTTKLLKILSDTKSAIDLTKGHSLTDYTDAEKDTLIANFGKACDVLNLTYEIKERPASQQNAVQSHYAIIYKADGSVLAEIDGDIAAKKTDSDFDASYLYLAVAALLVLGAAGAFVFSRKKVSDAE